MGKLFAISAAVLLTAAVWGQSPEKMSYQAVIRNSGKTLVQNTPVGMKVSILRDSSTGTPVYIEIYNPNPTTNDNGVISIQIGGGIPVTGTFSAINWASGPYYIKTETDPTGGTNYTITGTTQLLSVPYALYAKATGSATARTAFHVSGSGSWQAVSGADTYINWANEEYDLGDNFSNNTFTVPSNGVYHFDAVVDISFSSASTDQMILLAVYKNGNIVECSKAHGSNSANFSGVVSTALSLSAGDLIKLGIRLISGSGINVDGAGKEGTHFSGYKVD